VTPTSSPSRAWKSMAEHCLHSFWRSKVSNEFDGMYPTSSGGFLDAVGCSSDIVSEIEQAFKCI